MASVIIKQTDRVDIFSGAALEVSHELPKGVYELDFDKMTGLFLRMTDGGFTTSKIYGEVLGWCERVLETFGKVDGNLGVLFSGPTGLGKSLAVKYIAAKAFEQGIPVVYVKHNFGNITAFFDAIQSKCVVVFDEFEKLYPDQANVKQDDTIGQEALLNVFDTHFESHKLFLVTVNDIGGLSQFLLNRPGRLHYHFAVTGISKQAIRDYCSDNLEFHPDGKWEQDVNGICTAASRIPNFSYDMLQSLVKELNLYPDALVTDLVKILNVRDQRELRYDIEVLYADGYMAEGWDDIDFNRVTQEVSWWSVRDGHNRQWAYLFMAKGVPDDEAAPGTIVFNEGAFTLNAPGGSDVAVSEPSSKPAVNPSQKVVKITLKPSKVFKSMY